MKKCILAILLAGWIPFVGLCEAPKDKQADNANQNPLSDATTITSDRLQLDVTKRIGVFTGNVQVKHPKFDMKSKEVMVYFNDQNKPDKFVAKGDVNIQQGDRTATSREATYVVTDKKVVLTGDPTVVQNQNRVTGSTIIFYPESDRMDVQGRTTVYLFNTP